MVKRSASVAVLFAACMTGCAGLLGVDDVSYLSAAADAEGGAPSGFYQLPDTNDGGTFPDAATVAPRDAAPPPPDAIAPSDSGPDADPAIAACLKATCAAQGAECGPVAALCGGQPVDCGQCKPGYSCGDNNYSGRCGYFCLDTQLVNYCPGIQTAHAFNYGCNTPYWMDNGVVVLRPGGIAGCTYHQASANLFLECCP